MTTSDDAQEATQLLLPRLGPIDATTLDRVDGTNPGHPGQTFDFAVQRPTGEWLAIEVGRVLDAEPIAGQKAWTSRSHELEQRVRGLSPDLTGCFGVSAELSRSPLAKETNLEELVGAIIECERNGVGHRVQGAEGLIVAYLAEDSKLVVTSGTVGRATYKGGPEDMRRFKDAIVSNAPKLSSAGTAGYETHLLLVDGGPGESAGWWREQLQRESPGAHPQFIWALDPRAASGQEVERIYP